MAVACWPRPGSRMTWLSVDRCAVSKKNNVAGLLLAVATICASADAFFAGRSAVHLPCIRRIPALAAILHAQLHVMLLG